jgi:hypothetical protein
MPLPATLRATLPQAMPRTLRRPGTTHTVTLLVMSREAVLGSQTMMAGADYNRRGLCEISEP